MKYIFWILLYIALLGFPCIHVRYSDGVLNLHGWGHFFGIDEENFNEVK